MTQAKRLGALNKFKAGECNILICTDVAMLLVEDLIFRPWIWLLTLISPQTRSNDEGGRNCGDSKFVEKIKETGGKKRRKDGDDDEEEFHKYLDRKNGKSFKKSQIR
ncbi:hypothetical protein RJ640_015233 [Escallonia rubra]|uniref:Uncharacterized protein n=1 Tax=Escallonia rubra TaxID=112253 RepID=A0AA88USL7_9ASTE|nr:hypothetical protein RJ640_015233 [Escallonia rubra]